MNNPPAQKPMEYLVLDLLIISKKIKNSSKSNTIIDAVLQVALVSFGKLLVNV